MLVYMRVCALCYLAPSDIIFVCVLLYRYDWCHAGSKHEGDESTACGDPTAMHFYLDNAGSPVYKPDSTHILDDAHESFGTRTDPIIG